MTDTANVFDAARVRITGPLAPYLPGFDGELRRLGYTPTSAKIQLELVAHLSRWMADGGLSASELTSQAVRVYLAARRASGYTYMRSTAALAPLLDYLQQLAVTAPPSPAVTPTDPGEVLLERYRAYLLSERGVSGKTARDYIDLVRPFLAGRLDAAGAGLESVTSAQVSRFVVAECRCRNPRAAQGVVTAMRSLLRFLHVQGLLAQSLVAAVPALARRQSQLPRGVDQATVTALLDSCDQAPAGLRDFAILVLLTRLGLRCAEVAGLQLDDLDWRAGELQIRGKGNRCDRLPMPVDVGQALVAYLRSGRPSDALDRCVFIRIKAPHQGLSPVGITQVVVAAAARAGQGWLTAHRLRHTTATAMLAAGAPLVEIGQVLRHQRPYTTSIYAKVDIAALRALAMPWPAGAS